MSSSPTKPAKPATDARSAVGELLTELEVTRKEYAKLSIQLSQVDAELQQSKDANKVSLEAISDLEQVLVTKDEQHRTAMREAEDRYVTKDAALAHRARHLELEVQRLQAENEHMLKLEADNRSLRENMLDLQATIEKLQVVNEDLRQRTKDGTGGAAFEEMEKEFQKKLAAAEKKFRAEAYRALSEEAKIALQGNDHLQNVLKRQNDSIELVLQRCKTLEQSHGLMQNQQDRSAIEMEQQIREVNRLTKALEETRGKNQQLDEAMRQRRVERASLELLFVEYEASRKKLAKAEEKSRRSAREAERWKDRAVQLTQELGEEHREAAERRLAQLQSMSDAVEANAARDEYRTQLRNKAQVKHQQGSLAYQFATQGTGGPNSTVAQLDTQYSFVDRSPSQALVATSVNSSTSVKPMDILSIWSRNYDDGFTANANAMASGKDALTEGEAESILEGLRAGVSPLTITASLGGTQHNQLPSSPDGRPQDLHMAESKDDMPAPVATARPNPPIEGYNTRSLPPQIQKLLTPNTGSRPGKLPSVAPAAALSAKGSSMVVEGSNTRDQLVAERNRQLSVLNQSNTLHASVGSSARLPPAFQNQNNSRQRNLNSSSGVGGRSGSALGSRSALHTVGSDGQVLLVDTRGTSNRAMHPNPPQISPSTSAEIASRADKEGDSRSKIVPV